MQADNRQAGACAALFKRGYFAPIDYYFSRFIAQKSRCEDEAVMLAAALASRQTRMGHVCLDLNAMAGSQPEGAPVEVACTCPSPDEWRACLERAACAGAPGDTKPLILDECNRLYLYRMYRMEQQVATHIRARAAQAVPPEDCGLPAQSMGRLFPPGTDARLLTAAFSAAAKPLCIICGGPGTGKTTTAALILALLLEQPAQGRRVALAAPTGKAADRLQKAVAGAVYSLDTGPDVQEAIGVEAKTLHRLLGIRPHRLKGRYVDGRKLPADIVVVDEASMVDLPLMACLLQALEPHARLILLGDHNQLASVAPGAVLGDIVRAGSCERYSNAFLQAFGPAATGLPKKLLQAGGEVLDDCLNELTTNYRFAPDSGIARLGRAVTAGAADGTLALLDQEGAGDIGWRSLPGAAGLAAALKDRVIDGFREYLACSEPNEALARFDRFRIMCALREGPFGVQALNGLVERILAAEERIVKTGPWYHGRPVMITRNNYQLGLFNGDIGIAFMPEKGAPLRVYFAGHEKGLLDFSPEQMPLHETAFATTVHKAQGTEFDRALLLLPDHASPLLTRELVYTGITRVRSRIDVWADPAVLRAAISTRIERSSGLLDALR